MRDNQLTNIEFTSFESFLRESSETLSNKNAIIRCADFNQEDFSEELKSKLASSPLKIRSMEIHCNNFGVSEMRDLMFYIDDCHKPKITIHTENKIFPHSNFFTIFAHTDKKLTLDLRSADIPNEIARNRNYHQYFTNSESSQYRGNDVEILFQGRSIPALRASPPRTERARHESPRRNTIQSILLRSPRDSQSDSTQEDREQPDASR